MRSDRDVRGVVCIQRPARALPGHTRQLGRARRPGSTWICPTPDEVHDFIEFALENYDVDPTRMDLSGLGCGGFGVWEYLSVDLDSQVAAAVPVTGDGRPAVDTAGCALGTVPIWASHGDADPLVDPAGSIEPIEHLSTCTSPAALDAWLLEHQTAPLPLQHVTPHFATGFEAFTCTARSAVG